MPIHQQLLDLGDVFNFFGFSTLAQNIPIEWVTSAFDLSAQPRFVNAVFPAWCCSATSPSISGQMPEYLRPRPDLGSLVGQKCYQRSRPEPEPHVSGQTIANFLTSDHRG